MTATTILPPHVDARAAVFGDLPGTAGPSSRWSAPHEVPPAWMVDELDEILRDRIRLWPRAIANGQMDPVQAREKCVALYAARNWLVQVAL